MSASHVDVRPFTAGEDEARDAFAKAHPKGSFFHLSGWRRAVERVFGHEGKDLVAWRDGEICGLLPLMRSPGLLGKSKLISTPFGVYGGQIGADAEVEQELLAAGVRLADTSRVGRLELRYLDDPGPELVGSDLYWVFIKDLPDTVEGVLAGMPKKARAEARKARKKHELELCEGRWYVEDLYRLFLRNKHTLGSPGLPPSFFRELLVQFPEDVYVHLVRRRREPLAAVMSFAFEGTLMAYYSGTQAGADRSFSASNYMYMALQEWAVERGFTKFDFGRSRKDAGAFKFKTNQGFEAQPLFYRYHLVRDRGLPAFNPSNPRTAVLRNTWSKLPLWAVRRLSDRLARYLP